MGNDNSPEHSPNRFSKPRRFLISTKNYLNDDMPIFEKPKIIHNSSKLSRILSKSKNIINFIAQSENRILLKNMNDSLSIGLNHLNILIENDFNYPFIENQLKYLQIVDDSIDKKILGNLNYQSKEYNQKQIEILTNNLIDINNNNGNNINIGNISSIQKRNGKYGSREDSPASKDDELDLTSFSTTIGGKVSSVSNYNNSKYQNSKQLRTFKIRKKDGFFLDGNYNNVNNNKNSSSKRDSPNSTHSINSTDNFSNVLSSINGIMNSKNSSNASLKDKNSNINNIKINNRNNSFNNNNKNIIDKDNNSKNSYINNIHKKNNTNINLINNTNEFKINNKNIKIISNNKNISKKIIKKKLVGTQKQSSCPQDNIQSPKRVNTKNNMNILENNNSNIQNKLKNIDNNICISNINSRNSNKKLKHGFIIPSLNIENDNRTRSPNFILNNKLINTNLEEQESENSQVIFNNVRTIQGNNYSYSNNNSSMINNTTSITQNKKINNTNILADDKFIKYLNDSDSPILKTDPNKDNNSCIQGLNKKTKIIITDRNRNPFKNEGNTNTNKIQVNNIKGFNKMNTKKNENKKFIRLNTVNDGGCKKDNKLNEGIVKNYKNICIKKIVKKVENNCNIDNIQNKTDISNNNKNILNKNKVINSKNIEVQKTTKNNISQKNTINKNSKINNNNTNIKKPEMKKKNIILSNDLVNVNFLDDKLTSEIKTPFLNTEENIKYTLNTEDIFNKKKFKIQNNNNNIMHSDINTNKNVKINNSKINSNKNEDNSKIKKQIIKNQKKQKVKNLVFNIDLTNNIRDDEENDKINNTNDDNSRSEDISDNSYSHEEKIQINSLQRKIGKPLKEKSNIINNNKRNNNIINKKNSNNNKIISNKNIGDDDKNKLISFENNYNNKCNKIEKIENKKIININSNNDNNNKPKLKKEENIQNSKINRLVFDMKYNNYNNSDDLDDVCNFSGINNKSYTNEYNYNNNEEIINNVFNDDFKRAHSPKTIIHKKMNFDLEQNDKKGNIIINKNDNLNIINENNKDIYNSKNKNINICNKNIVLMEQNNNNVNKDDFKSDELKKIISQNKSNLDIIARNKSNNNNFPKSISNSSQANFSFKVKKNEKVYDSMSSFKNEENTINNKNENCIFESRESSKLNFKINDDIHESEFNDIEFLD